MIFFVPIGIALSALNNEPNSAQLTVYNQGFALIKENRTLNLKKGMQSIAVEDVAQLIEASSVGIRSLSAPGSFSVLEQNYQYDLISSSAILNKAVGKEIVFNRVLPNGVKERIVGTLVSSPTAVVSGSGYPTYNGMVIRTNDGRILLDPSGEIEVSNIPNGLISKPTLMWDIDSDRDGTNNIELSYLTQGFSWTCDYVMTLNNDNKTADLKGWVTMVNNSGASFSNAKLKLLAGDVQRAPAGRGGGGLAGGAMQMAKSMADSSFQEEQFADYHLYTLQRPATVRNHEQKQISLLEGTGIQIKKRLILDPMMGYFGYQSNEGEVGTGIMKPQIRYDFKNSKENHLGMPLPAGRFKIFGRDKEGSVQLLGEDGIQHTPKDETLSITVGRAFDVVAERKRTNFEWIWSDNKGYHIGARETFEIEIRNRKETAETVELFERYWGDWRVIKKTDDFEKVAADVLKFTITLKPNEVHKVIYTIENRWAK